MRLPVMVRVAALYALAGLAVFLGCGRVPTQPTPEAPQGYANPQFVRVPSPGAGESFGVSGSQSLSGTAQIDGAVGGSLTVGRFTVTVPAGAYNGPATVTISAPDSTVLQCNLAISPGNIDRFVVPVTLSTSCAGIPGLDLSGLQTLWRNPADGLWYPEATSANVLAATVNTPLGHFSSYGVADTNIGKSGW